MIIRSEQMDAMRSQLFKRLCDRLTQRLQSDPALGGFDAASLAREVPQILEDVALLGITEEDLGFRLLRFRFLADPLLSSPLIQSVVLRILHNLAWSAEKRLDFLEKHVLTRAESARR